MVRITHAGLFGAVGGVLILALVGCGGMVTGDEQGGAAGESAQTG